MTPEQLENARAAAKYAGADDGRILEYVRDIAHNWVLAKYPLASEDEADDIAEAFRDGVFKT